MHLILFGIFYLILLPVHALSFSDNFNRADNAAVGNGWVEWGGGTNSISGNRLYISNGSNESIGDNFVYRNLGENLTSGILSGILRYKNGSSSADESFYITLNAREADIKADPDATAWGTKGSGYGIVINRISGKYYIVDQTSANTINNYLKTGSISISNDTDYNFEFLYNVNGSLEARFWTTGSSRPTNATIGYTPGVMPVATGTFLALGITDEGNFWVDDIYVGTSSIFSENTNFGNVRVGTSGSASVTVTNTGSVGSTLIGSIGAATGSEFSPISGTQSFSLSQNQIASRTYSYTPTNQGNDSTTINITSNSGNTSHTLTGTGVSPIFSSSITPGSTIDFGQVDSITSKTLAIQNLTQDNDLGDLTNMTILNAVITGPDASYFTLSNFTQGMVLSKNQLQNLIITCNWSEFDPLYAFKTATLTITTDVGAALGSTGQIYTFHLQAVSIPESKTFILCCLGFLIYIFSVRFYSK